MTLVDALLANTELYKRLSQTRLSGVIAPELSNGDIAISYIGLLCQEKSDFECIEEFRKDKFFRQVLRIYRTPSSPTLRQRLDAGAAHTDWPSIVAEESIALLKAIQVIANMFSLAPVWRAISRTPLSG